MTLFPCPHLGGLVELSDEQERHIAERHPDLLPVHREGLGETLADPDQVRRRSGAGQTRAFSRWFDAIRGGKHVVSVVVSEGAPAGRHWIVTAYLARRLTGGRAGMEAQLTFKYDRTADILYIDTRPPYAEQESEELGDDVVARLNPTTGEIETLEVMFSTRLLRRELLQLPVTAELRPTLSRGPA